MTAKGRNARGRGRWGRGRRMGKGMGRGRGGGRGRGRNQAAGSTVAASRVSQTVEPEHKAQMLKVRVDTMLDQLQSVTARLYEIERTKSDPAIADTEARNRGLGSRKYVMTAAAVHEEMCSGCGICVAVCPEGAITLDGIALIDANKCTGCGSCVDECPNEAIRIAELKESSS